MNDHEKRILTTTCYGHFMSHFNMLVFPAIVLPLTRLLDMEIALVLGLSFWMYLFFGITALPWGMAADKMGAAPLMRLFHLGAGIGGIAAAIWINDPFKFSMSLAVIGFFSGIYHPAGLGLISKEIRRVSVGMGYNGMFGNLGLALAPLITGLANWLWGPRSAYLFLAMMNFFGLFIMMAFPITESKRETESVNTDDNGHMKAFIILLAAMMLGGIIYRGATVIIPTYFEMKLGAVFSFFENTTGLVWSKNLMATTVTSFIYLLGTLGQLYGGWAAYRWHPKYCYFWFHLLIIPMTLMMAHLANLPLVFVTIIYFFLLLGMQPAENTLVADLTPRRLHHSAYGAKFVLTFGVGALAVKMAGAVESSYGIASVFLVLSLFSVLLVSAIFMLIRILKPAMRHSP